MFDYKTGKTNLVQVQERVPYQYDIQEKIILPQLGRPKNDVFHGKL